MGRAWVTAGRFRRRVGVIPAKTPGWKKPLLIGAHYDSLIDAPCADDNAAAVTIALAAGAALAAEGGLDRQVIIAIFDAEEAPYFQSAAVGIRRFYDEQMDARGVRASIVMDLVGHNLTAPASTLLSHIPGMNWAKKFLPEFADDNIALPSFSDAQFVTGAESHPSVASVIGSHRQPDGLKVMQR